MDRCLFHRSNHVLFVDWEKGGKCIAVSFGVMPGLFPEIHPVFF